MWLERFDLDCVPEFRSLTLKKFHIVLINIFPHYQSIFLVGLEAWIKDEACFKNLANTYTLKKSDWLETSWNIEKASK